VVAFASAHFIGELDRFGLEPDSPIQTRLVIPGRPVPPRPLGIIVSVTPMSVDGALEVTNQWSDGGNSFHYCLHVVREESRVTVLVTSSYSLISAAGERDDRFAGL
jgi:hypothetical protein